MDNGSVIPCLEEGWTLAGAKVGEWASGFAAFILVSEAFNLNPVRTAPLLMAVFLITTFSLAGLRTRFADEERGIRNLAMVGLGFSPPGIPAPSTLQPLWSGAPLQELPENKEFVELGLQEAIFELGAEQEEGKN